MTPGGHHVPPDGRGQHQDRHAPDLPGCQVRRRADDIQPGPGDVVLPEPRIVSLNSVVDIFLLALGSKRCSGSLTIRAR